MGLLKRVVLLICNMGGKRKDSKAKDPNAPKRPLSAYFFFTGEKRAEVKAENPALKMTEIAKLLGEMWKEMDATEKAPYEKKAEIAKQKYEVEKAAYKKAS